MPRANRHFIPGYIWHITHRCHNKQFLLQYEKDRISWIGWIRKAQKRYDLCVLNYMATSNHIHLLVLDKNSPSTIASSMQLIQGKMAQAYNFRKRRNGSFWSDRYHATAVESGAHFLKCLIYIDLNMYRTGIINHPQEWLTCGYHELIGQKKRYRIINIKELISLSGCSSHADFIVLYKSMITNALKNEEMDRIDYWSNSIAVGSREYIRRIKDNLKERGKLKNIDDHAELSVLKEPETMYETEIPIDKGKNLIPFIIENNDI